MTVSEDLFDLIESLKQTEKRYFKIFAKFHVKGKENNYLKLFNAIEKQKVYDESALLEKFRNEVFVKQFAVTKNYLYNFILKSLKAYSTGKSESSRIREATESARILFEKGFYRKAIKILKKAKLSAYKNQLFHELLAILDEEYKINDRYLKDPELTEFQKKHSREYKKTLQILENRRSFRKLEDEIYSFYRRYAIPRSEEEKKPYDQLINKPLLSDPKNAICFDSLLSYYNIKALYHAASENYEEALKYDKHQLDLFAKNKFLIPEKLIDYIKVLNNLINNYLDNENTEAFRSHIEKMKALAKTYKQHITPSEMAMIFECTVNLELTHYFKTLEFQKAFKLIPSIEKNLQRYSDMLVLEFRINLLFTIGKLYFFNDEPDKAYDWVTRIVYEDKNTAADDLFCFARILNLLIHYDLGNYNFLKSEVNSTRRYLKKKNRFFKAEEVTTRHLLKLSSLKDDKDRINVFREFKEELDSIMADPFEEHSRSYLNLPSWINARIAGIPIIDAMRKNHQQGRTL